MAKNILSRIEDSLNTLKISVYGDYKVSSVVSGKVIQVLKTDDKYTLVIDGTHYIDKDGSSIVSRSILRKIWNLLLDKKRNDKLDLDSIRDHFKD